MAYTKNLGRVKGDDGDIYVPTVKIQNGYLHFDWELVSDSDAENTLEGIDIIIPVYVPTSNEDGTITFTLNQSPIYDSEGKTIPSSYTFNAKGKQGDPGTTTFEIVHVSGNIEDIPIKDRKSGIIYVKDTKAWFYDEQAKNFFMLEGIDLSDYYRKSETYNKNEIDEMFNEITSQMTLAYRLLDIEDIISID